MLPRTGFYSSECYSAGYPDKACDLIADSIVDACLDQDENSHANIHVTVKGNHLYVLGDLSTTAMVDVPAIATDCLRQVGCAALWGIDPDTIKIVHELSNPDPETTARYADFKATQYATVTGYACNDCAEALPLGQLLAQELMREYENVRQSVDGLGIVAKAQVTVYYEDGVPRRIDSINVEVQHITNLPLTDVRELIRTKLIEPTVNDLMRFQSVDLFTQTILNINASGACHLAPNTGVSGRHTVLDLYGGATASTSASLSGKDGWSIERCGTYAARQLAKTIRHTFDLREVEIQLSYAAGVANPVSMTANFSNHAGSRVIDQGILFAISGEFMPKNIVDRLGLNKAVFAPTAACGHFGVRARSWEHMMKIYG